MQRPSFRPLARLGPVSKVLTPSIISLLNWKLLLWFCLCGLFASLSLRSYPKTNVRETSSINRPIWWHGPFLTGSGYGYEAIDFITGLLRLGVLPPDSLWLTNQWGPVVPEAVAGLDNSTRESIFHMMSLASADSASSRKAIIICHSVAGSWSVPDPRKGVGGKERCPPFPVGDAAYVIGRTMWEMSRVPPDDVERCNKMDEVWVPTAFNKQVYRDSGVVRPHLEVMPGIVDTDVLDPSKYAPLPLPVGSRVFGPEYVAGSGEKPFIFVSIFRWSARKGWDVLLRAYLEEFGPGGRSAHYMSKVMLIMHTRPYNYQPDVVQEIHTWVAENCPEFAGLSGNGIDMKLLPRLYVTHGHMPNAFIPQLYRTANVFVLPTRGEGWGRIYTDAMSMGLPVIATNWSAPTEYVDSSVGYPLEIEGLVTCAWDRRSEWAQPSFRHLRELMRHVVGHPEEVALKGLAARARMQERYAPEVVARKVVSRLQTISSQLSKHQRKAAD